MSLSILECTSPWPGGRRFLVGTCEVLVGVEDGLWHLSISHPKRHPRWQEIFQARYALCPSTVEMVMHLPPPEEYVNVHPHCFHLWELRR